MCAEFNPVRIVLQRWLDPPRHVVTRELAQEEAHLKAVPYERRDGDRYAIRMNVRCRRRLSGRRAAPEISAVVVDISSTGVLICPAAGYRLGTVMELAINWPVLYQRVFRMALAVTGSVVRNEGRGTAIRITSHALKPRRDEAMAVGAPESEPIFGKKPSHVGNIVRV